MGRVKASIFRAYDVRGEYPFELNEEAAYKIAAACAFLHPGVKKLVVSRDPRLSSPSLANAVIKAFVEAGKEVVDIGVSPDPLFYFSIFHYRLDGGIMVSGSHNPKNQNGLSISVKKAGENISQDLIKGDLEEIKKIVMSGRENRPAKKRGKVVALDPSADYIDRAAGKINLKRPLKIIIDSGNGACGFLPEKVFKKLGCQVETLYGEFDGNFPNHMPNPYEEKNVEEIKKRVVETGADLGFAYDSDGDRVAPIDGRGRLIGGDFCLLMLARQALKKEKGPIVHCMRASKALLDEMERRGVKTYFSVSHHNAIIRKIVEKKAVFGGEITYHFLFPRDFYLCDDAVFSSLKMAAIASEQSDFAEYIDDLPRYFASPEISIGLPDNEKFQIIENLQRYLEKNGYDFIGIDGARINFPRGWALARASNTEPKIKCRFEGETAEDLKEIEIKSLNIFKEAGIPVREKTRKELGL